MSGTRIENLGWIGAAAAAWLAAAPARAQFPDVLSDAECPGCAAAWRFAGTWSTPLTSADDPIWSADDFRCTVACRIDAGGARVPVAQPRFACDPPGLALQALSPLPLRIELGPGRLSIDYEEFGARRTVWLDGGDAVPLTHVAVAHTSGAHAHSHAFGFSTGRFENGSLVVETVGFSAGRLNGALASALHGERLRALERYTPSADGKSLRLVLEVDDLDAPGAPLVVTKTWRRAPNPALASYHCDVMSGQLEDVLFEYVDPAKLRH